LLYVKWKIVIQHKTVVIGCWLLFNGLFWLIFVLIWLVNFVIRSFIIFIVLWSIWFTRDFFIAVIFRRVWLVCIFSIGFSWFLLVGYVGLVIAVLWLFSIRLR